MKINRKITKLKVVCILIVVILSVTYSVPALAVEGPYDIVFSEYYGTASSSVYAKSPQRDDNGNDIYTRINSKNNQPRNASGSNPHQGTDFNMSDEDIVYSIYAGTVRSINRDLTYQLGSVVVECYDTSLGTFYIKYLHIIPSANLSNGSSVSNTDLIGTIDSEKIYDPHLHMQILLGSTTGTTNKLLPLYRYADEWNYGYDLEFIAGNVMVGNTLYLRAYTKASGQNAELSSLRLYYKIGSGGTWSGPANFTLGSGHLYSINLKNATGASTGQTVYYYVVGLRAGLPAGAYNYGFFPQYYKHPDCPLSASYANTICRSFTVLP